MARIGPPQFETEPSSSTETSPVETDAPTSSSPWPAGAMRSAVALPSLPESHRTIPFLAGASRLKKLLAFAGPGYLVAVGYMDPGNWATDLAGGARYGYTLLTVVFASHLMAVLLQALAVRRGTAPGRDLAQACRDHYSRPVTIGLWILCEIAIAACDL